MYGMVATHNKARNKTRNPRDQNADDKDKKRSVREKILDYLKKRFDPPPEEEVFEYAVSARHRPEPPAALAKQSRFTTREIKLMYRGFKQECPSGMVDEETFKNIFSQFFPLGDATQYAHFVFNTIKHKQSGKVNFEEFLSLLSRVGRGSAQEKLSWVFALYDADGDGRISRREMTAVARAVHALLGGAPAAAAAAHVDNIFHLMAADAEGGVSMEELCRWCARSPQLLRSLDALDTVL